MTVLAPDNFPFSLFLHAALSQCILSKHITQEKIHVAILSSTQTGENNRQRQEDEQLHGSMGTTVTGKMGQDTYKRNREAGEPLGVWRQSPPFLKTKKCPAGPAHILFPFCRVPQFPLGLSLRLPLGLGSEVGIDSSKAQPRVLRSDSGMVQGLLHPSHHKVHDFSRRHATV